MEPRLNIVTLGVYDLSRSVAFYRDGLGWPQSGASVNDFAIFKLSTGTALALYPRHLLAEDVNLPDGSGFGGITLAHNVPEKAAVDLVLAQAVAAGGMVLKAAQEAVWGGYSGYFADPDGYPWEVAWNPFFVLSDGQLDLPD
jgi:catechol 2,3-dioxygenase-like lactoylglutathione lyase family enzyme